MSNDRNSFDKSAVNMAGPGVRARNPHVFKSGVFDPAAAWPDKKPSKRIRQSDKPLMNGLEQSWFDMLCSQWPHCDRPRAQAKKYKIGNNAWYKPDITASLWPHAGGAACETAWECKGPKQMKNVARGILAIKAAAHQWPEVRFILVWKDKITGSWQQQTVLP